MGNLKRRTAALNPGASQRSRRNKDQRSTSSKSPASIAFPTQARASSRSDSLGEDLQHWIGRADTFFVASAHPEGGADASHRGGFPGFVRVVDGRTLTWPDYDGNRMFNTLGNLVENPRAGLLFLDFENGRTLQLSGTASASWDPERAAEYPGAQRLVDLALEEAVVTDNATALRWRFLDYSPENPWVC